jgi:hypothetical protein
MFDVKVQDIGVGQKFHADCVTKGGMPGDTLVVKGYRYFTVAADRGVSCPYCRPFGRIVQASSWEIMIGIRNAAYTYSTVTVVPDRTSTSNSSPRLSMTGMEKKGD